MSHSYKKTPICGFSKAESNKKDKRFANRNLRRESKETINNALSMDNLDNLAVPIMRECSCVWAFAKDGKQFFDPLKHPKEMRK